MGGGKRGREAVGEKETDLRGRESFERGNQKIQLIFLNDPSTTALVALYSYFSSSPMLGFYYKDKTENTSSKITTANNLTELTTTPEE